MPDRPTSTDVRLELLRRWAEVEIGYPLARVESASSDASFRRYFRIWLDDGSTRVVMDAPPQMEDTAPFLHVAQLLEHCEVHVPHVYAADRTQGFVLLEDLGSEHYLAQLRTAGDPEALYRDALDALLRIQTRGVSSLSELPSYDRALLERKWP